MKNKYFKEMMYQARYGLPVWFCQLITFWLPDVGPALRIRGWLTSLFLKNTPRGLLLGRDVTILSANKLSLGDNVYLAKGVWVNAIGGVVIDSEVSIAPYVTISSTNHGFKNGSVFGGGSHPGEIKIGKGSWIASHVSIGANTVIGKGVIIGANSVVSRNIGDHVVAVGVPCKEIKKREDNPSTISSKHEV